MPKKKRTRQDKVKTDVKRQSSTRTHVTTSAAVTREAKEQKAPVIEQGTFSLPQKYLNQVASATHVPPKTVTIATAEYSYLRGDLLKTTLLTFGIVILELLIHFFVMN